MFDLPIRSISVSFVRRASATWTFLALAVALTACADRRQEASPSWDAAAVDDARLVAADADRENWLAHGRTYKEQRHSPLTEINEGTIDRLALAWYADMGTIRGLEATPIVVDGTIYVSSSWSILHAFDAATGEHRWTYDPKVDRAHARFVCCDVVNRGVAAYDGKIYAGTIDGRLVAVTADSGELVWEAQTTPVGKAYSITGAPRIAKGRVLIGNGGAEFGVRGYVSAYDARTGELDWRTYTVPGDPALGHENEWIAAAAGTWSGDWWQAGGGGTAWDAIVYDPELDLVYIGVGNGSPWYARLRSPGGGDNLYLSSILAVRADDGTYAWHYQTTPGDNWDYTATQPLMLAELEIDGARRRVIMQAPKNGFFYVIDRETGEFISGKAFANITWATGLTPDGRPIENLAARALEGGTHVAPGPNGSHNWHPMSFNPETGLVYFSVYEHSELHSPDDAWAYDARRINIAGNWNYDGPTTGEPTPYSGHLVAWNPVEQREVWRVEHPQPLSGGTLSTASGIVFQGRADGRLRAYRATDGEVLWEFEHETGIAAAPITYSVDGRQYVAVVSGWGGPEVLINGGLGEGRTGPGRLLAFALDAGATLPEPQPPLPPIAAPTFALEATEAEIALGDTLFSDNCVGCHGLEVVSGGITPDLRRTSAALHAQFEQIVLGGLRAPLGMPSFADLLSSEEVRRIQAYVLHRARESAGGY
ncbi:MAG TPA: PQQ-dependent dehydrogenase, methanol/ethanol family [Longimicrobiales bacterium]|nr:PQQ-dependent dehydrogenase, methanol/ethanol family [Longimicrobiales bacterium]